MGLACTARLCDAHAHLSARGVSFDTGLREQELETVELRCGFLFPPDLRWFLGRWLPIGHGFPNWRQPDSILEEQLRRPIEGILYDVAENHYWRVEWGIRPNTELDAVSVVRHQLRNVPALIPIWKHSYLPSQPTAEGNPVFSVDQSDVIHRGAGLADYLLWLYRSEDEVSENSYPAYSPSYRHIDFWTDLARENFE